MRGNEELPAELKAFEAQLAALVPEDQRLDRAKLLFAAGRASARRSPRAAARAWATAFGAMTAAAAALVVVLVTRSEPPVKIVERIVRVPAADQLTETEPTLPNPTGGASRPDNRVPGPKRSGGPDTEALADEPYPLRRPMPEQTSVLAAVFFGIPDEHMSPIRRTTGPWRVGNWDLTDDPLPAAKPANDQQTPAPASSPQKRQIKTYRQLFNELTKAQG